MAKIITKLIISIILIILLSFVGIYISFIYGVNLKNLDMYGIKIEQLYIKIDKKFVIKGQNINIESNKDETSSTTDFKKINSIIVEVFQWLPFFQEIDIKNIKVSNQNISLINYKSNIIIYDTDISKAKVKIYPNPSNTIFNVEYVYIKSLNEKIENIRGNYIPKFTHIEAHAIGVFHDAIIKTDFKIYDDKIDLILSMKNIKSIAPYKQFIPQSYHSYIEKTSFNNINIDNIELTYIFDKTVPNIKDIKASILDLSYDTYNTKQANIHVNNKLTTNIEINNTQANISENIKVNINSAKLSLTQDNKFYLNFNDLNSSINTTNIMSNTGYAEGNIKNGDIKSNIKSLNVYLKDKSKINLDDININGDINKTLNISANTFNYIKGYLHINSNNVNSTYKLENQTINIKELTASYKTKLNKNFKKIGIKNLSINHKNNIDVSFFTNEILSKNISYLLKEFGVSLPIYQKSGTNKLFVNMIFGDRFDINLDLKTSNSILSLTDSVDLNIKNSELKMKKNIIELKNSDISFHQSVVNFDYKFNGILDLNEKYMELKGKFGNVDLENILQLNNFKENVYIDLNNLNIELENLSTRISFNPLTIIIDKVKKYVPHYKLLQEFNIKEGFSKIVVDKNVTISTYITDTNQSLLLKNSKPLKELAAKITLVDNKKIIETECIYAKITDSNKYNVKIKDIDINITKFLEKNDSNTENKKITKKEPIFAKLTASNSSIIYKNFKLYSKNLKLDLKDDNMTFVSLNGDNNITGIMKNGNLKIYGINIDKKTIRNVTDNDTIKDILLNFLIIKYANSEATYGFIELNRGYIKEMKAFNNIVAFINTIPSLVTFSPLGYSEKGFKIKTGYIDFIQHGDFVYFKKIYVKGENMLLNGQGYIDLRKELIKMNLDASVIVKLIKDIPLVGYILLGKDGGITVRLTLDGDMKNPNINKNTLQNIIESPFNLLYRTITSPFNILNSDEEE
jgi:hypothetical protein